MGQNGWIDISNEITPATISNGEKVTIERAVYNPFLRLVHVIGGWINTGYIPNVGVIFTFSSGKYYTSRSIGHIFGSTNSNLTDIEHDSLSGSVYFSANAVDIYQALKIYVNSYYGRFDLFWDY